MFKRSFEAKRTIVEFDGLTTYIYKEPQSYYDANPLPVEVDGVSYDVNILIEPPNKLSFYT